MGIVAARSSWLGLLLLMASTASAAQREDARLPLTPLDLAPVNGDLAGPGPELAPVLAGDKVLVTSTLRLFALAAASGELLWSAGPPPGWDALDEPARDALLAGVDHGGSVAVPAAGERVAVAALQLPSSRQPAEKWHGLELSRALPERRLFAFELATGRALWNHAPAEDRYPGTGRFEERMSVVGPPLVVGERVLVACTSDESSLDFHVACYDLASGALRWTTFVVRGQVEHNMFGRRFREFAAPPLVVARAGESSARDRVIVQTGLGVVAALDPATGRMLWRASYAPIELPKARSYHPPLRDTVWRTAPPVVAGDVVLAAPSDSPDLLAFDLVDGRALWTVPATALGLRERDGSSHLLGERDGVLYLGGERVAAFAKPGSLRSRAAFAQLWSVPGASGRVRARLAGDALLVPDAHECAWLDRASGRPLGSLAAGHAFGLLVTRDAAFVLTRDGARRIPR